MFWLWNRMREPSSHAGAALLLQAVAAFLPAYAPMIQLASMVFAGGAVALPEQR